jgi:hypothetical protein
LQIVEALAERYIKDGLDMRKEVIVIRRGGAFSMQL